MTLPDRDTLATYGGEMQNYSDPVDPTTDEEAEWRNKYAANVAMATHTLTRAARSFLGTTGGATAVADPSTGFVHDALWGDTPGVKAAITHVATGTYDAIWPTQVLDELGDSHTLQIRRAWAQAESSDGTLRLAHAKVTSAQKVRVYTYQPASASSPPTLSDLVGETITVFTL
jgi:hypothetical protein